jgi:FHS family L-fucose permease-like MFS transporter
MPARPRRSIFSFPHLWLGVLCLFLYVGVEVMAGDAIGTYGQGFGLPLDATKHFTSYTLIAMLLGYLAGLALIPRFISQQRYLAISAVLGVLFDRRLRHPRLCFGRLRRRAGLCQRDDVAGDLPAGDQGPGQPYRARLGAADHGHRRRRDHAAAVRAPEAAHRFPARVLLLMVPCYLYILYYGLAGHRVGQAHAD